MMREQGVVVDGVGAEGGEGRVARGEERRVVSGSRVATTRRAQL